MSEGNDTRRVFREREAARLSSALRHVLEGIAKISQAALADDCGVSVSLVRRWLDPNDPCLPGAHDVACMRPEVREPYLQAIAGDDFTVARSLRGRPGGPSLHDSIREAGEFLSTYSGAAADNRYTTSEKRQIAREGRDAIEAITTVVRWAEGRTGSEVCS